jgi:hypothetical protein
MLTQSDFPGVAEQNYHRLERIPFLVPILTTPAKGQERDSQVYHTNRFLKT